MDFLVQASAAAAGPLAGLAALYAIRTYREMSSQLEENTEALWGSDDPFRRWDGVVIKSIKNEKRIDHIEDETDIDPPRMEDVYMGQRRVPHEGADRGDDQVNTDDGKLR